MFDHLVPIITSLYLLKISFKRKFVTQPHISCVSPKPLAMLEFNI